MIQKKELDEELVSKVLGGDTQLFKTIIINTQNLVLNIIYKMIVDPEDRKDISQEVYLKVFNKLSTFKFNSKLSTWIATITYNTCLNYLSKKKIPLLEVKTEKEYWGIIEKQLNSGNNNQIEYDLFQKERFKILEGEIDKLSPLFKTIIVLYHKQELSYKEISTVTGLPEGTLKSYLFRARAKLKTNLLKNFTKEEI